MKLSLAFCLFLLGVPAAFSRNVFLVPSQYPTIQSAIDAVPGDAAAGEVYKIKVAPGEYHETVVIPLGKPSIALSGQGEEDPTRVVIVAGLKENALEIQADNVKVKNLTLQNTATPPTNVKTTALRASGQRLKFVNVRIIGFQDTVYLTDYSLSYFSQCEIAGTVDFICGGGTAYFDACEIRQRLRPNQDVQEGINAATRTPADVPYGFVFVNCAITRDAKVPGGSYLMRPWGPLGHTAYLNCKMDKHIASRGWLEWSGREKTCRAFESNSTTLSGVPIDLSRRASWVVRMSEADAEAYLSRDQVLSGWVP